MEKEVEFLEKDVKVFGFWIYLMTDLVIFAALFATFVVLRHNTFGGPTAKDLFTLPTAIAETFILLTSSFTCSLATYSMYRDKKKLSIFWFFITFVLGVAFIVLELREFSEFIHRGASWERSAFLSAFFALVSTHGFHVSLGLLWMIVAMFHIGIRGLTEHTISRAIRLAFFWHFLDVVWIFIFSVVYGMGLLY